MRLGSRRSRRSRKTMHNHNFHVFKKRCWSNRCEKPSEAYIDSIAMREAICIMIDDRCEICVSFAKSYNTKSRNPLSSTLAQAFRLASGRKLITLICLREREDESSHKTFLFKRLMNNYLMPSKPSSDPLIVSTGVRA